MSEGAIRELLTPALSRADRGLRDTEGSILFPHVALLRQHIAERLAGPFDTATKDRLDAIVTECIIDDRGYGELAKFTRHRRYVAAHKGGEPPRVLQEVQQGFDLLFDGMKDGLSVDVHDTLRGIDALKNIVEQQQGKGDAPPFAQEMYGKGVIYSLLAKGCADGEMYKIPLQLIADAIGQTVDTTGVEEPRDKLEVWRMMMSDYTNTYGFGMFAGMRWSHRIPYATVLVAERAAGDIVFGRKLLENPESAYAQRLMIEIARQELAERAESNPRRKYFRENLPDVLTRGHVWPDDIESVPVADYLVWLFQNEERQWANVEDIELFSQLASQLIVRNIQGGRVFEGNDPEKMGTLLRKIVWQVGYGLRKASQGVLLVPDQDLKDFAADDKRQIIEAYGVGRIAVGNIRDGIATLKSLAKTRGQTEGDVVSVLRPILDTIQENARTEGTALRRVVTHFNTAEQLSTFLAAAPH